MSLDAAPERAERAARPAAVAAALAVEQQAIPAKCWPQ